MQYFVAVAVFQAVQELRHIAFDLRFREAHGGRVHEACEVVVHVLEYHVNTAFWFLGVVPGIGARRALAGDDFFQVYDVFVVQRF